MNSAIAGLLGLGVFLSLAVGSMPGFAMAGLSYVGMVVMLVGPRRVLALARLRSSRTAAQMTDAPPSEDAGSDGDAGVPVYRSQGPVLDALAWLGVPIIAAARPVAATLTFGMRVIRALLRLRLPSRQSLISLPGKAIVFVRAVTARAISALRRFIVSLPARSSAAARSVTPRRLAGTLVLVLLLPVLLTDMLVRFAWPYVKMAHNRWLRSPQIGLPQRLRFRLALPTLPLRRKRTIDAPAAAADEATEQSEPEVDNQVETGEGERTEEEPAVEIAKAA